MRGSSVSAVPRRLCGNCKFHIVGAFCAHDRRAATSGSIFEAISATPPWNNAQAAPSSYGSQFVIRYNKLPCSGRSPPLSRNVSAPRTAITFNKLNTPSTGTFARSIAAGRDGFRVHHPQTSTFSSRVRYFVRMFRLNVWRPRRLTVTLVLPM